jgi:hypothetical protein
MKKPFLAYIERVPRRIGLAKMVTKREEDQTGMAVPVRVERQSGGGGFA